MWTQNVNEIGRMEVKAGANFIKGISLAVGFFPDFAWFRSCLLHGQ
jgi:hypothetical protein